MATYPNGYSMVQLVSDAGSTLTLSFPAIHIKVCKVPFKETYNGYDQITGMPEPLQDKIIVNREHPLAEHSDNNMEVGTNDLQGNIVLKPEKMTLRSNKGWMVNKHLLPVRVTLVSNNGKADTTTLDQTKQDTLMYVRLPLNEMFSTAKHAAEKTFHTEIKQSDTLKVRVAATFKPTHISTNEMTKLTELVTTNNLSSDNVIAQLAEKRNERRRNMDHVYKEMGGIKGNTDPMDVDVSLLLGGQIGEIVLDNTQFDTLHCLTTHELIAAGKMKKLWSHNIECLTKMIAEHVSRMRKSNNIDVHGPVTPTESFNAVNDMAQKLGVVGVFEEFMQKSHENVIYGTQYEYDKKLEGLGEVMNVFPWTNSRVSHIVKQDAAHEHISKLQQMRDNNIIKQEEFENAKLKLHLDLERDGGDCEDMAMRIVSVYEALQNPTSEPYMVQELHSPVHTLDAIHEQSIVGLYRLVQQGAQQSPNKTECVLSLAGAARVNVVEMKNGRLVPKTANNQQQSVFDINRLHDDFASEGGMGGHCFASEVPKDLPKMKIRGNLPPGMKVNAFYSTTPERRSLMKINESTADVRHTEGNIEEYNAIIAKTRDAIDAFATTAGEFYTPLQPQTLQGKITSDKLPGSFYKFLASIGSKTMWSVCNGKATTVCPANLPCNPPNASSKTPVAVGIECTVDDEEKMLLGLLATSYVNTRCDKRLFQKPTPPLEAKLGANGDMFNVKLTRCLNEMPVSDVHKKISVQEVAAGWAKIHQKENQFIKQVAGPEAYATLRSQNVTYNIPTTAKNPISVLSQNALKLKREQ